MVIWKKIFNSIHYSLFITGNNQKITVLSVSTKYEDKACSYNVAYLQAVIQAAYLQQFLVWNKYLIYNHLQS